MPALAGQIAVASVFAVQHLFPKGYAVSFSISVRKLLRSIHTLPLNRAAVLLCVMACATTYALIASLTAATGFIALIIAAVNGTAVLLAATLNASAHKALQAQTQRPSTNSSPGTTDSTATSITAQQQLIERLALASEAAKIGVWDWDLKANRVRTDSNMAHIFEHPDVGSFVTAQEFVANNIHPGDLATFNAVIENAIRTSDRISHRYRHVHADGTTHHVQLHGRVIRDQSQEPLRLLVITWDITLEVDAQQKIKQQTEQLQQWIDRIALASETAGIGMWDWDLKTNKLASDTNMAGIFKDADLTGVSDAINFVTAILHPGDREQFLATMRSAIATQGNDRLSTTFRYLRKDGGVHHVELHGRVVRNDEGRAERFLGISWNVTTKIEAQVEKEQQAAAQRLLLERLNLATEVAGLDIWDWDLASDHFTADTHLTRAYGNTHFEIHGGRTLIATIVHPEDVAGYLDALDRAIESGNTFFYRYRMVLHDGTQHHVQAHARIFRDNNGKALRFLGITIDVTEEIERLTELRRQADEERALRDRLNLATKTAGIGIWHKDLVTDVFTSDEQFWEIVGLARDTHFKPFTIVHADDRERELGPLNAALTDTTHDDILHARHRTSNPRSEPQYVQTHMRIFRDLSGKAIRVLGVTRDITDEVLRTEELRRKADQERALVERLNITTQAAGIAPWEFDLKLDRFSWHGPRPACFDMDDVPLEEYYATLTERVEPEDRILMTEPARIAIENGRDHYEYRFRFRSADGELHYMQNYARILRSDRGNIRYCVGVTWDITKEVHATEQLRTQAELERTLVDRLNVATQAAGISPWEFDLKSNQYIWFGKRLTVLGLDNEPLNTYYDALKNILLPEDRNNLHDAARDAIINNIDVYSARYRAHGTDGQVHYLKNFVRVLRSPRGTAYRLIGVTWDISEEVSANALLTQQAEENRKLVERLSIATESANIGSWEMDLVEQRFLWVENPVKSLGIADADFGSLEEFTTHIVPEDRTLLRDNIRNALRNNTNRIGFRYRIIGIDGSILHIQTYGRIITDEHRRPLRALGVSWEVTKEVHTTEQLREQADHERALVDRLNVSTQAAGISPWEFSLKSDSFIWFGMRLNVLGLDDEPLETYFAALRKIVVPEDEHILVDAPSAALKSGVDAYSYRYRVNGIDGVVHHMKNYVRILRSARGTPYRLVGVTWDISEEVAANQRLEEQVQEARMLKERLSVATLAAGISPFEIDLVTGKFLWVENPIKKLAGIRGNDNALTTFSQRIHPEDINVFRDEIVRAAKGGYDIITYRHRTFAADGSVVHLESYAKLFFNEKRRATRALGVSWDATDDVETAARLQEQTEKERKLIERLNIATDSAGISSWEIDLVAAKFLWIENRITSVENESDKGNDDLSLERFAVRILPEDRNLMANCMQTALLAGTDRISYLYRAIGGNGNIVHVQTFARIILNANNKPVRVLGVSWDVTREVQAAEQLRRQTERLSDVERRLERASLSSSEGHWEAELATGHLWCSSSFHTLLGYVEGELDARVSALDYLVHPDDRSAYHEALRNHLVKNEIYDVETRMRMGNGEYRWFRMRGMAERDADGNAKLMAGSIHDVHQQKLIEDALNLAQRRFERAINGTQDGLWELEIDTDSSWCSPRLALLLGYPTAQLEKNNFMRSLIHPDDAPKLAKVTESHYRHNTPFDVELRMTTRSGEYRWYRARATADRDKNGRAVRLSGSLQDVTEARAAREELVRATEAAEAASRAKSTFLANVSHEIRTPMNGIIGMTGLLIDTQLDRTQRDYANTIRGSADSLLSVINDILDFSKIEAGKLDLENIDLDLRANVEDVGSTMAFQAANKGLELIINVHPEVPERVLGDPQRLRQCLINLVGNAIKFTKSGEIVVDVCAVGRHDGRILTHFEVRDTGLGIAEETLKTLFQPFVQADASTTRHFGGTGLGLSIVRRLVEMMGGQVGVVSEVGKGSNFFFTLSLEPVDSEAAAPHKNASVINSRILVVDDNTTNRRVLDTMLTHQGYRVITAASGAAALDKLQEAVVRKRPFDMVITDFQMPDMDGVMLGERIGKIAALANLRLVMLTSLDRQGDSKRLANLGFAAYLTKPIRTRELLDCVARVLSGEARQWQMEIRPMLTHNSLSQAAAQQRYHGRVLVVEDNVVNQKVATRFLERMGCTVRVADDGAEGVAAFTTEHFDIVLMDLQMPIMDGLTATRAIRDLETSQPTRGRTPVIALTANAMRGDQERCEAAGMDGFLTKPIEIERLRDILLKFGFAKQAKQDDAAANEATRSSTESPLNETTDELADATAATIAAITGTGELNANESPPINLALFNAITDGDAEFAQELITTFLASCEEQLSEIDAAKQVNNRDVLARSAHKLRGACANIHAEPLCRIAARLETEAHTLSESDIHACNEQLQKEFVRAKEFLSDPSAVAKPVKAAS